MQVQTPALPQLVWRADLEDKLKRHLESTCSKRMVDCNYCNQRLIADQLEV